MDRKEFSCFQRSEAKNIIEKSIRLSKKLFVWLTASSAIDIASKKKKLKEWFSY